MPDEPTVYDITDFVVARLDEEGILTDWASKVKRHVLRQSEPLMGPIQVQRLAATWHDHPDYRAEWDE